MIKIFRNFRPFWKMIVVIVLLLVVQAYCDLSMPAYTADIIDVGITNSGVEHILPEKIKADEFKAAELFMSDSEKTSWENSYKEDGDVYVLTVTDKDKLNKLDDQLLTPIVLTYQLGHMTESTFKETLKNAFGQNPAYAAYASKIDDMSLDQISQIMHTDIKSFKAEDENGKMTTYVDARALMKAMISSGQMSDKAVSESKKQMEETIDKVGSSTLKSMGISYAASCDKAAGIDVDKAQMSYLWTEGRKLFLMALLMLLASVLVSYFAAKVGAGIGRNLRASVFKNVVSFSNSEMDQYSTASLITRSTNDVQQVQMVSTMMLRMVLYAPIIGIGGVYKVYSTGAHMGWVIGLAVLVIAGFVAVLVSIAMPKFKIMQKLVDALNLVSREILTGLSVIRAFGREKTEEERFDKANVDLMKTQLFTNRVMTFMFPGMMMIMNGLVIAIMWVSIGKIDAGTLQVGAMTAFITYAMQIVISFLMLTILSIMLPRAGVAADRIDEVLKTKSSILDPEEPEKMDAPKGVVEFKNVSFRYPGAPEDVLSDINFRAEPGKVTAIIGSTGSGKTTMVNLIPRFYDVTEGQITFDGVDIRKLAMKDVRQAIGFVPQKGILFSGTIASNIRFGNGGATDEEVRDAAEIAQADTFIDEKEEGYESFISQGGSNVSGGQKQRLAIARAIAKNPKVFVFDDSFSALDMKTDSKLRHALSDRVKDSTEIIVAQRISTIIHADQILVVDEGRLVGKGTHEELLQNCEVYRQIAMAQLSAKELGIEEGGEQDA